MASNYTDEEYQENIVFTRSLRRTWSSTSDSCSSGTHATPKCVCAPATHARSFKCRFHRANSHSQSAPTTPHPSQPAVSTASTRTVEAQ
ncbi:hypothetical protein QJS10_CPA16g00741 [Acorus calamus]|uniref:Uncharacterized protein n=1 Tax=Acorus calamus TaxID=4465 RepID=A0AAV9D5R7_ACOCL|nr:hypothetical protein QJS10_CPA16g00741 [Acorus calamus]